MEHQSLERKNSFSAGGSSFNLTPRYEFIKKIGHGAYGVVVSAVDHQTNMKVAIKKVSKAFDDLVDAKRIVREIKLLGYFDHDNIITLLDIERPPARTGYDDIYIITDLMETDLHRVIYSKQAITDEHIQYFLYQALRGVLYMHSGNIIHRDLKPSNLLLNKNCDLKI
jgi:mitogen-activated protein kinase 1/3